MLGITKSLLPLRDFSQPSPQALPPLGRGFFVRVLALGTRQAVKVLISPSGVYLARQAA